MDVLLDKNRLLQQAIRHEQRFSSHGYDGQPQAGSFVYQQGTIPILLSAPHAVNHFRDGRLKAAEVYTGAISLLLHELTRCHIIYKAKNDGKDPNHDSFEEDHGYKQRIVDSCREHGITLFIDLHGAAASREIDLDLGTNHGQSLQEFDCLPRIIQVLCAQHGLDNVGHNKIFSADPPNNVTRNVGERGMIPALQFEVNRRFRQPQEDPERFVHFVQALCDIIGFFAAFNWNPETYVLKAKRSNIPLPMDKVEFAAQEIARYGLSQHDTFQLMPIQPGTAPSPFLGRLKMPTRTKPLHPGYVYLTTKLYEEVVGPLAKASGQEYILVQKSPRKDVSLGIPRVGVDRVFLGSELVKDLDPKKGYQLYNRNDDIDYTLEVVQEYQPRKLSNRLYLNYFQRQLMNLNIPKKVIPAEQYASYLNKAELSPAEKALLQEAYENHKQYYRIKKEYITDESLKAVFRTLRLDRVELIEIQGDAPRQTERGLQQTIRCLAEGVLRRLIDTKPIQLRSGRPYSTDEDSDIVRIMPTTMKILGICELDKVVIEHRGKRVVLRALEFDSFDPLLDANPLVYDEAEANVLIGIPAKYRHELGILSLNSIVTVSRDMQYLFVKNGNHQVLPIIGVVFTILQTFQQPIYRILLCCAAVPAAIYVSLSQERARIDRRQGRL